MNSNTFVVGGITLGVALLLLYLHQRTARRNKSYLEEVKRVINGRWVKGMFIVGSYKGRDVRCGIYGNEGGNRAFLQVWPNKNFSKKFRMKGCPRFSSDIDFRNNWIESRQKIFNVSYKEFFSLDYFTNKLNEFSEVCRKIEAGEIRVE